MPETWQVVGLSAGTRCDELAGQANRYRPETIAISSEQRVSSLDASLNYAPTVYSGPDAMTKLVSNVDCDCVFSAVVGTSALSATLRAVELGRRVALANKESLVIAGSLMMPLAKRSHATIVPVDSEHSAIFQCMLSGSREAVEKVYLTASGGPFWNHTKDELDDVTLEDALRHPTWKMGPKITIDSATMMNKALEVIEAKWLFDLDPDQIEVLVHPESIIHSMVEFVDHSIIAQLGQPDMRTPIQYALTYPDRLPGRADRLNLTDLSQLSFFPPDSERFPAIKLGYEAVTQGGTAGAVLNAANEAAVKLFRSGAIHYRDITRITQRTLKQHDVVSSPTLDDLLAADRWAREEVERCKA